MLLYAIAGVLHSGKPHGATVRGGEAGAPELRQAAECLLRNGQLLADRKGDGGHAHGHHDRQHRERQEPDAAPAP